MVITPVKAIAFIIYKEQRRKENKRIKEYLRGTLFYDSNNVRNQLGTRIPYVKEKNP